MSTKTNKKADTKAVDDTKTPRKKASKKADAKADDTKTSRKQVSKMIGIDLSVSRVRVHLDKRNINANIEDALGELRVLATAEAGGAKADLSTLSDKTKALLAEAYHTVYDKHKEKHDTTVARLSASKTASDKTKAASMGKFPARSDTAAEGFDYVSKLRCRFSTEASIVLASALDYMVQGLVRTAMTNARARGKKIIKVSHVLQNDFSQAEVSALVASLDVVKNALKGVDEAKDDEEHEEHDDTEEHEDDDEHEHDEHDNPKKQDFKFYVNQICKSVKAGLVADDETAYSCIRISQDIRKFGSDVVVQMIKRVAPLIKMYTETADIKTVNEKVVTFVFNFLLVDAGRDPTVFNKFVSDRLEAFRSIHK